jgi:hypothetical protein
MRNAMTRQRTKPMDGAASLRGSEATLNEQLARDETGKLRDDVLDELAVAAQDIETALCGKLTPKDAEVLRELLGAIRIGATVVSELWHSFHG